MYAYFSDNSTFGKKVEEEIRLLGVDLTVLASSEQVSEVVNGDFAAIIIVNPFLRQVRSVRTALGKLGGRVSMMPVIGVLENLDHLTGPDVLRTLDDFVCGNDVALEIETRVKVLRARGELDENAINCGELIINLDSHQVLLSGRPVDLTYKEFELLRMLASTPGRAYSREDLLKNIWGYDYFGGTRTVDVHVRRLRSKIEQTGKYIETVHGIGYRFAS
ncbi:MAG: winged-helix domain-containing protein [Actinobacteria bacterium]|nr:winged-helix domain-containing protein [Actinomycetota bacterium]